MFKLKSEESNNKTFYLKNSYSTEETFDYELKIFNHISKTGFTMDIQDESPWVSGKTNVSELSFDDKVEFYSGNSYYISAFSNLTHIFNNIIQISGVNHTFYSDDNINYTQSTQLGTKYGIIFNDITNDKGMIVIVDSGGTELVSESFCDNAVSNLRIVSINISTLCIGYYDRIEQKSYLKEVFYNGTLTQYDPTMFYNGEAQGLDIDKVSSTYIVLTYHTNTQGIIQLAQKSIDHIFSVGFPFVFNDDLTLFSSSAYQDGNVVVLYYDVDDQLKVRNCRIYDEYISIGIPSVVEDSYCYDLNIGILDDYYAYISYYSGNDIKIYTSLIKVIEDDITIINNAIPLDDWSEGMFLTTINDSRYMISYMDSGYTGVYRYVDMDRTQTLDVEVDYNEFNIDLTHIDTSELGGHNDYWIYYSNEVVEKGVCYITQKDITYNT